MELTKIRDEDGLRHGALERSLPDIDLVKWRDGRVWHVLYVLDLRDDSKRESFAEEGLPIVRIDAGSFLVASIDLPIVFEPATDWLVIQRRILTELDQMDRLYG